MGWVGDLAGRLVGLVRAVSGQGAGWEWEETYEAEQNKEKVDTEDIKSSEKRYKKSLEDVVEEFGLKIPYKQLSQVYHNNSLVTLLGIGGLFSPPFTKTINAINFAK